MGGASDAEADRYGLITVGDDLWSTRDGEIYRGLVTCQILPEAGSPEMDQLFPAVAPW